MIYVICGPSGVGKSTLAHKLLSRQPALEFSISHTTRPPRTGERDGVDYFFVSAESFQSMVDAGGFAEHAQVHGYRYGTARATLTDIETRGHHPLLDIDFQGARQVLAAYPDAVTVLVAPPSLGALRERLAKRASDSDDQVQLRLSKAKEELSHFGLFEYLVVNSAIETAVNRLEGIYLAEQARMSRNESLLARLLNERA